MPEPNFESNEGLSSLDSYFNDELGHEFLQYMEDIIKTNNGGLSHLRIKRKVVRAYKSVA